MLVTRADVARLGRRQQQPTRAAGELLAVFVAGKLTNPLNGSHGHWSKHARWAKGWRERTSDALLLRAGSVRYPWPFLATDKKRVTFHAIVASRFDDDNFRACCKPLRDALKDMRVIDDDRDSAGHVFLYSQEARRKAGTVYGVEIRVALLPAEPPRKASALRGPRAPRTPGGGLRAGGSA